MLLDIELSIGRVIKKIDFMLELKGMSIMDWINTVNYGNDGKMDEVSLTELLECLDKMNVRLEADEKLVLVNELGNNLSDRTTVRQIIRCAEKYGLKTN
jgi:hypothetical protein